MTPSDDRIRGDSSAVARFNEQAFAHTAFQALPVIGRRVQVLLQDDLDTQVLETVLSPEPQSEVAQLAHGLDKVLFKYVVC